MKLRSIFIIASLYLFVTQCDSITSTDEIHRDPKPNPDPEPTAVITQVADSIGGYQGKSTVFQLSDYFESDADFTHINLQSKNVDVKDLGDEAYQLTQDDSLFGEQIIDALLINSDSDTMETTLRYVIAADTTAEDSDSGSDDNDQDPEPEPQPNPSQLVIMPLGDSITNDSRSRVKLWNLLSADGHELDYVGNQYQQSTIPDPDHEGVGGIKIQGIADKVVSLMKTHNPNYVNLMVGTNDIAWYFDETGQEIADRWNQLVQDIFDNVEADAYVIAATIPPVSSKNVGKSGMPETDRAQLVKDYNTALRAHVEERREAGDRIVLADVEAAMNLNEHVSGDGVHLNAAGNEVMGTVYYEAITATLE